MEKIDQSINQSMNESVEIIDGEIDRQPVRDSVITHTSSTSDDPKKRDMLDVSKIFFIFLY